jgi:hypothetical protein
MPNPPLEQFESKADAISAKLGRRQIGGVRYLLMWICVLCQAITVLMTWQLWQVRADPPLLPALDVPFQIPFGILLLMSLVYMALDPRRGLFLHLAILLVASFFDQMRLQPQFFAIWMMMFATVYENGTIAGRWFLATMWFWAGLHKFLSPDWLGMESWSLVERAGWNGNAWYLTFAIGVAAGEMFAGLAGMFRPRLAMWICPAMHFGIMLFLSPLFLNWNFSVLPWNFCTGVIGCWIMWGATSVFPKSRWELLVAAAFLLLPIGFYFGWLDHGFSNVLYSDNLPRAVITSADGSREVTGWGPIRVPFPNERRLFKARFVRSASIGDKMHLYDPRPTLPDQYFRLGAGRKLVEISSDEFFSEAGNSLRGISYDSGRSIFKLGFGGARLLQRQQNSAVYAIEFNPQLFRPELLDELSGLANLEQIQLGGCHVVDDDLKKLAGLKRLTGIGLSGTEVTDQGLKYLQNLPDLQTIEYENTKITGAGLAELFRD